jgi:hypothetical protein
MKKFYHTVHFHIKCCTPVGRLKGEGEGERGRGGGGGGEERGRGRWRGEVGVWEMSVKKRQ